MTKDLQGRAFLRRMAAPLKGSIVLLAAAWSSSAMAALDWCHLATLFPSSSMSFEDTSRAVDQLGCRNVATESAHFRMWECSDQAQDDTVVFLERLQTSYRPGTILTFQSDHKNLDHLRKCPGIEDAGSSFEPESLAWTDEVTRKTGQYGLYRNSIAMFAIAGSSYTAGGTPDAKTVAAYIEGDFFGYKRPTLASSSVELAGKDLYGTPFEQVVEALVARGAHVTSKDDSGEIFRNIKLSAPVGLEGVSEISIQGLRRHVWKVMYTVPAQPDYEALIAALDSKYGRSQREDSINKGCSYREWATGSYSAVEIVGEYCPAGSHIWFKNMVIDGQLAAHRKYLDEMSKREDKKTPVIDRDNI